MTEQRAKEVIMAIILSAFDMLPVDKRSAAFAEMAPKISTALFKRDTQPAIEVPR